MTKNINRLILGFFVFASISLIQAEQASVKLEVMDETGKPVPDVDVFILFEAPAYTDDVEVKGKTNAKGLLEAKGWPKDEEMDALQVTSNAPGYYPSILKVSANPNRRKFDLKFLIRKKQNPIPMYAKQIELELPEQRKEIGFDLEKGDWVKPYGKGEVADFMFMGQKNFEDRQNFETSVIMSFPGKKEGMQLDPAQKDEAIQLSEFKTSRTAPLEGYQHTYKFTRVRAGASREGSTEDANYIFRSRVVLDEAGKIKSANYGKMLDAVNVASRSGYPDGNPIVSFTYYFNPTPNDRNLEFDPEQNLFPSPDGNLEISKP